MAAKRNDESKIKNMPSIHRLVKDRDEEKYIDDGVIIGLNQNLDPKYRKPPNESIFVGRTNNSIE